jgi:hypothetical protein
MIYAEVVVNAVEINSSKMMEDRKTTVITIFNRTYWMLLLIQQIWKYVMN